MYNIKIEIVAFIIILEETSESKVNPETGPQYQMNLLYLIEVLMGKFD